MNGSALAFLVRAFHGEKKNKTKHFNLHYPQKGKKPKKKKKKKIPEEENSLESERAQARHLNLRLYALIQCAMCTLTLSTPYF